MGKKNSVLVIDDQVTNIRTLNQILGDECIVYAATNGQDGIKAAKQHLPDVILLDILMLDMDGYAVIEELKKSESTKSIPVIFVTSLDSKEEEEKGLAYGAADYISKPFHAAIVKRRVKNQIKLKTLQRDLEDAVIAAQAANNAKSAFLANISHEIRTPMNVIVGLTELLLEDETLTDEMKDHLEKIDIAGDILLGLISDVLDITKIESGKLTLTPARYDMAKLLSDIVTLNITRIEEKPITFKLIIEGDLLSELYGDDLRVKQVLNNLLSNAFKYTKVGAVTLTVRCERAGEKDVRLIVSVTDTGIGIRQEDIKKLFQAYNQVDTQANRHIEGTGLGLSITKGLSELMNGEITVESEYGKGSTFNVSLLQGFVSKEIIGKETADALRDLRYKDRNQSGLKLVRPDLSYIRILVVDDHQPNLDVARWMFGKYRMKVDCVTSGQESITKIQLGEPVYDAIFMDHMMPGMDGIEAVRLIRSLDSEKARTIPIIALTANTVVGNERLFLENGFQAFLSKPVDLVKLDAVIRQWIMKDGDASVPADKTSDSHSSPAVIDIPGVNAKLGLLLYENDRQMYLDVLRSFADSILAETDKLCNVSADSLPAYAIDVHTVKGSGASIGARDLTDLASRLEMMAKAGDLSGVLSDNEKLICDVDKLVADVREWLSRV